MRMSARLVNTAASIAVLVGCLSLVAPAVSVAGAVEEGKKIAFSRKKGNCLACHTIEGGKLPGTIGPTLIAMKSRYPNKSDLKKQISDARVKEPNTIMPPFGPHQILSPSEIDKVVEFIYTL